MPNSDSSAAPPSPAGTLTLQTHVYVVVAAEGEFSNREEWIAGIYLTSSEAENVADSSRQTAAKKRAIWQDWSDRMRKLRLIGKPIADAGPEPTSEWPAYDVIEVPVGQTGRWEAFNPT